ncbi:TIGR02099 family protein [Pseudoalteromonas sp. MMG010]|uniref:YhdP family protein n=1 Tax=Pseudoalteromonas sp. MMG010 TaxID=2822685 RepID=UPI001B39FF63|nr:YhdP family protein [Pseudoalteromonas sp. MMG010]MBQ4832668.1 TIGR02099 family protein [Pseudoalteromonas sp. MMG010]
MSAKTVCFFCLRKLWQICAITLVLLAVIVSILKYTLPYANDYKGNLEHYLHDKFNINLAIGTISASWHGNGPALVLEDLSFKNNESSPIALTIAKTSLELNLWESIKTFQIKSNYFVINGFHTTVNVSNVLNRNDDEDVSFQQIELIEELFLGETGHFAVENSSINFVLRDGTERKILFNDIVWQNEKQQHLGSGTLALPGISVGSFDAHIALQGDTLEAMAGDIYLQVANVDVTNWLAQFINTEKQQLHSDINLQAWLSIDKGLISDVNMQWLPSFIRWQENQQAQQISLSEGGFHLFPEQESWHLKSTGLAISSNDKAWPSLEFEALFGEQNKLWLQQVDFGLLNDLALLTNFKQLAPLTERNPTGQIKHAYISYSNNDKWKLWFEGQQLGWQEKNGIPAAQALRINGQLSPQRGRISIFGEDGTLATGTSFKHPIAYNQINIELDLVKRDSYWQISSDNLWFDNNELTFAGEMQLSLTDIPRLDLYAEVYVPDATNAEHYFPLKVMPQGLVDYLSDGILAGEVTQAQVLFSGPLQNGYPFSESNGQFSVAAQIDNASFSFDSKWPAVTEAQVKLLFNNQRMDIFSQQGHLVNLSIEDAVHVSIADLTDVDEVKIKINKKADMAKMHAFFAATPLATPLANVFEVVQGKGQANADIELLIGSKYKNWASVSGDITLNKNPVFIAAPGIQVDDVSGVVHFENDKISLTKATGSWLGMPLDINYTSAANNNEYQANVNINLLANAQTFIEHGNGLLDGFITGKSDIAVDLGLNFTEQGFNYRADVTSSLIGISSQLPTPYNKTDEQAWPLSVVVQGDNISNLITSNVNDAFYFNAILENGKTQFSNAHFILGSQNLGLNQRGLEVAINLEQTELIPWLGVVDQITKLAKQPTNKNNSIMPAFNQVVAHVDNLSVSSAQFNDVDLRLAPYNNDMQLKLSAKELRAEVFLPHAADQPIRINSDYLRVNFNDSQPPIETPSQPLDLSWLANLPAIEFICGDCKIDSYQLDKVNASLAGDGTRLTIPELFVDKGEHQLRAFGQWQGGKTQLEGELKSDNIGALLNEFDITTTVKDSDAEINYNLAWQGAPYAVDIGSLSGEIKWQLGEGHLTEISDGGARVFSLLSLDSLVRKLKLDFRDVFSKGFFYNSMQGTLQLDKGIAYTKDTSMDGVPADLTIKGYANLNTLDINYDLAVAPQVTSSIPVIVAWMVNPVTGLAALAIDKVIHSARVISEINFKVTGTMSKPIVQELDRKSREVTLPQAAQNQPQAAVELKLKDANTSATNE